MADDDTESTETPPPPPPPPPPVEIPSSFTERFLWSHLSDPSPLTDIPSTHQFPEEMLQEIQAAAMCAFAGASLEDQTDKDATVQGINLFCPYEGGHPFVDSMVKLIASQHNADVLVLDALELASVQFGALGKVGGIIGLLYNEAKKSSATGNDDKTQRYVDALVNATIPTTTGNSTGGGHDSMLPASRRIIYLRDFGSISCISRLLLSFILRSIQKLNRRAKDSSASKAHPPPTILVLGFAAGIKLISGTADPDEECRTKWHNAVRAGGQTLRRILPSRSFRFQTNMNEHSCSRLCPLSAQFFLPQAYSSSDLKPNRLYRDSLPEKDPISKVFFTIFAKNAHSEESTIALVQERGRAINEALLRLSIGERGGLMDGNLDGTVTFKCHDKSRTILSPPCADQIAVTAIGLVTGGELPLEPSSCPPRIPVSQVIKAYEIHLGSLQAREDWIDEEKKSIDQSPRTNKPDPQDDIVDRVRRSSLSKYEKELLGCIVKPEMLTITFDDVCAEPAVVDTLRSMVSLPLLFSEQFSHGVLARQGLGGVLLYGPPGTGKTTLCRALAYECGAQMLIIKPSDIFSKWVGESEKLATAVFSLARRLSPCVVFIDEAETLFGERSNKSKWRDDVVSQFLQEMDGFCSATTNTEKRVVMIGATNRPFDLDPAILRRLPRRMMVGLPGTAERKNILKIHLKGETLDDDVDLDELANVTDEYSGSDLKDVCVAAVMAAMKAAIGTPDWKSLRKYKHLDPESVPIEESEAPAVKEEVEGGDNLKPQPNGDSAESGSEPRSIRFVRKTHFTQALEDILPSFSVKAQAEMYRWHKANSPRAK